jgi:hypothetical protein
MVGQPGVEIGRRTGSSIGARSWRHLPDPARRATPEAATATGGSALLLIFVVALFLPGTFSAGPIQLSLYKIFLLLTIIPFGLRWIRGQAGPVVAADILVLLYCLWQAAAIFVHHGTSEISFIGTNFIEIFGGYLVGRVLIRSAADYRAFFRYFLGCLVVLMPFALVELVTGKKLLRDIFGLVFSTEGYSKGEKRLGLTRVALGFQHPIHFGFVCSMAIANVYYIFSERWLKRMSLTGFVTFAMFLGLSSAPMLSGLLQFVMIGWDRIVRFIRGHWVLFVLIGVVTLAVLQLALPGGLIGFVINEVIFNPIGGNQRVEIFQYGLAETLRNPVFGIGLNEWRRPFWLGRTFDNYWLLQAMTFGIPAFALFLLSFGVTATRIMGQTGLTEEEARYRTGYVIALTGTAMVLATVALWQAPVALLMAYLGAGAWFYTGESAAAEARRPLRRMADRADRATRAASAGRRVAGPAAVVRPSAGPVPRPVDRRPDGRRARQETPERPC